MAKANLRVTRDLKAPESAGEHHRILCMTGENKGISYYLKDKRFVMGRAKEADIQVLDSVSSREHVELTLVKGKYVLTDLGSHNGVVINDLKVKQHSLLHGDKIIIGKTIFQYNYYTIESSELTVETGESFPTNKADKDEGVGPKKEVNKRKLFYGVGILLLIYMFLDEGEKKVVKKERTYKKEDEIDDKFTRMLKKKVQVEDAKHVKKLNVIIGRGLREMREKNYFRAIEEFEIARILSPSSGTVSYYISKAKQYLDEDITKYFLKSRREIDALKFMDAQNSLCSIIQLLRDYPDDERYVKATKEIKELEKKLGLLEGEIACLRGIQS